MGKRLSRGLWLGIVVEGIVPSIVGKRYILRPWALARLSYNGRGQCESPRHVADSPHRRRERTGPNGLKERREEGWIGMQSPFRISGWINRWVTLNEDQENTREFASAFIAVALGA